MLRLYRYDNAAVVPSCGGRDRRRGGGVAGYGGARRPGGHRRPADDCVQRHDAPAHGLRLGEPAERAVPVPAGGEHAARGARRTGQRHAHVAQRIDAVQRVHDPGPGRVRQHTRHVPAGLRKRRQQVPPHDQLFQRPRAIRKCPATTPSHSPPTITTYSHHSKHSQSPLHGKKQKKKN